MALFGRGLSQGGGGASSGGGVSSSISSLQTQIDEINVEITNIQEDISNFDTDGFIEVVITDLETGDVISWNGTDWINTTIGVGGPIALDDLTDVTVPTPSDKDILMWDQGSMLWINHQPTSGNTGGRVVRRDTNGDIDVRILTATTVTTTNLTLTNVPANLVPSVRSLATTAPLRIDGGASADLSANRTLSINVFAGSTPGSVPTSPGGETLFLNADGDWVSPEGTAGAATVSSTWDIDGQGIHLEGADSVGLLEGPTLSVTSRAYISSPASAPTGGDITNGQVSLYQDEALDYLKIDGKESGGTTHTWIIGAGGLGAGQLDTIPFTFDAGSGNLLTARSSWKQMKFAGSMTDWTMTSDASDTFGFTITKCAYADFDTFSAITGGTVPALSGVKKNTGTDNAGVTFSAGDFVKVTLTGSPASASQGRLDIGYKRT